MWVYGSEAHPEEHPFADGYETVDLGWSHEYTFTVEMAQRAQRAKWLKSDPEPDFEIPMFIDYVGDPSREDNAVRRAYTGAGFYSGFVIDCDGKILDVNDWAWFAPGKEWYGLPLEPIENLYTLLDNYLADPPVCYDAFDSKPPRGEGETGTGQRERRVGGEDVDETGDSKEAASPRGCQVSTTGNGVPSVLGLLIELF